MRVNVGPIRRQRGASLPIQERVDSPERFLDEVEFAPGAMIDVRGQVTNTGKGFLAEGTIRTELQFQCARCLKPVRWPLAVSFCERFRAEDDGHKPVSPFAAAEDDEEEADEVHSFSGDELDLAPAVREQILVAVPMKAVCTDDCRGICPTCGADLSDGPCSCSEPAVDIRLAPLAEWLRAQEEHNGGAS